MPSNSMDHSSQSRSIVAVITLFAHLTFGGLMRLGEIQGRKVIAGDGPGEILMNLHPRWAVSPSRALQKYKGGLSVGKRRTKSYA